MLRPNRDSEVDYPHTRHDESKDQESRNLGSYIETKRVTISPEIDNTSAKFEVLEHSEFAIVVCREVTCFENPPSSEERGQMKAETTLHDSSSPARIAVNSQALLNLLEEISGITLPKAPCV